MSSYKKFDPTIIRTRIKEGAYPTLAGANRAIGKTQGLSEEDKAGLKKLAAKHFGGDAPAPVAKKAGKKAGKKAATAKAPKAAKKASKKASKKKGTKRAAKTAPAAATEVEPAPASTEASTETLAPKKRRGRAPAIKAQAPKQLELDLDAKPSNAKQEPNQNTPVAKANLMGSVIGSCDQMLRAMTLADNLIPKDVATEGSTVVAKAMTRAVQVLDQEVISPLLKVEVVAPVAKPKKTPPPKPKNPVTAAPAKEVVAEDDSLPLDALSAESDEEDGDDADDDDEQASLTEEEQLGVEALRENMPGNLPGLRVPGTPVVTR